MRETTFEYEDRNGKLWAVLYEVEPYNPGGRDEPPSGGYAIVTEILHSDGSRLPIDSWESAGFDEATVLWLAGACFEQACDRAEARREAAIDHAIDVQRDREMDRRYE